MAAGATATITQRIALDGADAIKATLADLGATGESAVKRIQQAASAVSDASSSGLGAVSTAAGNIGSAFETMANSVVNGFSQAATAFEPMIAGAGNLSGVLNALKPVLGDLGPLLELTGAVAGGVALFALADHAANATRELVNTAAALGFTTEQFEGLKFAAGQTGADTDRFTQHMAKFVAVLGTAQEEYDKTAASAGVLAEKQSIAADKQDLATRTAQQASEGAALATQKLVDSLASDTTAATKATEAHAALAAGMPKASQTAEQLTAAHQKLANSADTVTQAFAKLTADKNAIQQSYNAQALGADRAMLSSKEQALAMDDLARAAINAKTPLQSLMEATGAVGSGTLDTLTKFNLFIDGLKALNNPAKQAQISLALFGRSWVEMAPEIAAGSAGLKKFSDQWAASGLGIQKDEEAMGTTFAASLNKLKAFWSGLSIAIGNIAGQIFVPIMDALSDFIADNAAAMRELATSFAAVAVPAIKVFIAVLTAGLKLAGAGLSDLNDLLNIVAAALNGVFGSHVTGEMIGWTLVLAQVTGGIRLLTAAFGFAEAGLGALGVAMSAFLIVAAAVAAVAIVIYVQWDGTVAFLKTAWEGLGKIFAALMHGISDAAGSVILWFTNAWDGAVQAVKDAWTGLTQWISDQIDEIVSFIQKAIDKAIDLARQVAAAFTGGASSPPVSAAGGGAIYGAGTGTSDSIDAKLSHGEFVVQSAAVRKYGVGFLAALNAMRLPSPGFALGGLVDALTAIAPRPLALAGGGAVLAGSSGGGRTLNLTIDGSTFSGLIAPEATAGRLVTFARSRSLRSAGKKPSWYKG